MTLKDVALAANVSIATVSRALRNDSQIPLETCQRIQEIARKLSYNPNPFVTALMATRRHRDRPGTISIACVSDVPEARIPGRHVWSDQYHEAVRTRAKSLGFELEVFFLDQFDWKGEALLRILYARGFSGLLWPKEAPLPTSPLLNSFSIVVVGQEGGEYSCVNVDNCQVTRLAFEKAWAAGYRRPGFMIQAPPQNLPYAHEFCEVGLLYSQRALPVRDRVPLLQSIDTKELRAWTKRHHPDVIISNGAESPVAELPYLTWDWIAEFHGASLRFAGINLFRERWGRAAVDLLATHLYHNEQGGGTHARHILIRGQWVDPRQNQS